MRLSRKTSVALAAMVLTAGGAIVLANPMVFAQSSPNPSPRNNSTGMQRPDRATMRQDMEARIAQQLNLTPDQITRSQAIRDQAKGQITPLEQQVRQAREEMKTLFASSTATESQLRQKYQQIQQLHQQVENIKFDGKLAFWQILTPEQKQKFSQLMASHERMSRQ